MHGLALKVFPDLFKIMCFSLFKPFPKDIALKTQYLWLRSSVILLTKNNKQENTDNFSISSYLTASLANEFVEKRECK